MRNLEGRGSDISEAGGAAGDVNALSRRVRVLEQQLRASEEKYSQLVASLQEGFALGEAICDPAGVPVDFRFLEINEAFTRHSGLGRDILGRPMREALPALEEEWVRRYTGVALSGKPESFVYFNQDTGRHYDVFCYSPARGQFVILFLDLSPVKRKDAELRAATDRASFFAGALHASSQPFASGHLDGRLMMFNRAFAQLTGYTEEELNSLRWTLDLTPPEWREPELRVLEELHRTGKPQVYRKEYLRKDGQRVPIEVNVHLVRNDQGEPWCYYAFVNDITGRKEFEAELERQVRERTAALKETTDQLNAFVYTLAHDLRAPLRAQAAFATLLLEDYAPSLGPQGTDYVRRIAEAAERQALLLSDLLKHISLGREDLPLEPVDLRTSLKQAQSDLVMEVRQRGAVLDTDDVQGWVLANPASLHLVLVNLLSNALKFTRPSVQPKVRVWTESKPLSAGQTGVPSLVRLWVEDNGLGIRPEHMGKLFGVFQRLHASPAYPGTGIGLAIVKRAAERMGGSVGVESEPGKGSRFWVELKAG